jgi:hypothetical protein
MCTNGTLPGGSRAGGGIGLDGRGRGEDALSFLQQAPAMGVVAIVAEVFFHLI